MAILSLTQAAKQAGVGTATVHRYLKSGKLSGVKNGRDWEIDTAELFRVFPPKLSVSDQEDTMEEIVKGQSVSVEEFEYALQVSDLKGDLKAKDAEIAFLKDRIEKLEADLKSERATTQVIADLRKETQEVKDFIVQSQNRGFKWPWSK